MSVHLSVCLFICLFVCLSVCLSDHYWIKNLLTDWVEKVDFYRENHKIVIYDQVRVNGWTNNDAPVPCLVFKLVNI